MVDRYWRQIESVENNIENAMQISGILLKLKGYDEKLSDLGKIQDNENNISSNLGIINTNEGNISSNLGKINTNEGNISSILSKLNNMDIDVKKYIYKKTFNINNNMTFNETHVDHNSDIVNDKFSIPAIECENVHFIIFLVNPFNDNSKITLNKNNIEFICNDFTKIPKTDYNIDNITSNLEKITANESSISSNSGRISTNEGNISSNSGRISTNEGNISSNTGNISTNEGNISSNLEKINDNSSDISSNLGKIDANISDIASNLEKINDNKDDIIALQTSNVKAFYNLDRIFIYDIENGYETVSSNNFYHIFEKEISHTFIKIHI